MGFKSFFKGAGAVISPNPYKREGVLLPVANPPQMPPDMIAVLVFDLKTDEIVDHEWFLRGPRNEEEIATAELYAEWELIKTNYPKSKYRTDSVHFKSSDLFYEAYPQLPRKEKKPFW